MNHCKLAPVLILFYLLCSSRATAQTTRIVVAKDGTGRYTTVAEALGAVPRNNKKEWVIFIKNWLYKEKLRLDAGQDHN